MCISKCLTHINKCCFKAYESKFERQKNIIIILKMEKLGHRYVTQPDSNSESVSELITESRIPDSHFGALAIKQLFLHYYHGVSVISKQFPRSCIPLAGSPNSHYHQQELCIWVLNLEFNLHGHSLAPLQSSVDPCGFTCRIRAMKKKGSSLVFECSLTGDQTV